MDKRKIANKEVKDKLLQALLTLGTENDWSKITVTNLINESGVARASFYRNFDSVEGIIQYSIDEMIEQYNKDCPCEIEDFHNRDLILYKFRFYQEHASLILSLHKSNSPIAMLDILNEYAINTYGDMPITSIEKYALYYYTGAVYNVIMTWLLSGMKESPEEMTDEFFNLMNGKF